MTRGAQSGPRPPSAARGPERPTRNEAASCSMAAMMRRILPLFVLVAAASAAGAALVVEPPAGVVAPALAAPPVVLAPGLAAPLSMSAPAALLCAAPALAAPAALGAAAAPAAGLALATRGGTDQFGHPVILIDALDPAAPERGTVGHVDVSWHDAQASLDGPLDFWAEPGRPEGVPEEADLTHFRENLWFGLAVLPEYRRGGLATRLLDAARARLRALGVRTLFIRATESSVGFYRRRYGSRVLSEEPEPDGEGGTYYRLEVDLTER